MGTFVIMICYAEMQLRRKPEKAESSIYITQIGNVYDFKSKLYQWLKAHQSYKPTSNMTTSSPTTSSPMPPTTPKPSVSSSLNANSSSTGASSTTAAPGTNKTDASTPAVPTSGNFSTTYVAPNHEEASGFISSGAALAIFLVISLLVIVGGFIYYRRKGKLHCKPFKTWLQRGKRRSSTSSQGPLTEEDEALDSTFRPQHEMELFSIGDNDDDNDGNYSSRRAAKADYYYEEMLERSAVADNDSNRANNHITADGDDDDDDDEDEDGDVWADINPPDVLFKKSMKRV